MPKPTAPRTAAAIALTCLLCLYSASAFAWGYQGHRVVGSIAGQLLNDNAREQVRKILNEGAARDPKRDLDLRKAGPWADCVKSVERRANGTYDYVVNPEHLEWEVPCTPFKSEAERARMVDYAARNWSNCLYLPDGPDKPPGACHNTYHFEDVAIQRDHFDRSFQGTSDHDLVAAITAAIAVLRDEPAPPPFSIKDKKEALLMLTHFMGDLHQPLHMSALFISMPGAGWSTPISRTRSFRIRRPSAATRSRTRTSICTANGTTSRPTSAMPRHVSC